MSRENVEIAYRAQEAFRRRDLDAFLAYVDPEAEWQPLFMEMETYQGLDGVRRWWANLLEVFPDWHPAIAEARDLGDFVLVRMRQSGSGAGSGVGINEEVWIAAEIRDGRIVWYATFRTEAEALEAVGLRE